MVISYLGALKTLLYAPILALLGANVWTIRLPMVLAGAITVFVFYRLTLIAAGPRAALLAAFLLATDPLVLMTNTFDWGPVAIEHLLLVTGCWAWAQFGLRTGTTRPTPAPFWDAPLRQLALGCLCFGLALWNKAIFSWALAGLGVGALAALRPWWRALWTPRALAVAATAFLLGAAPLVAYNVRHGFATFRENAQLEPAAIPAKWVQLESALQGSSVFGYIAAEEWMEPRRDPRTPLERASVWLRQHTGEYRRSGFYWVLGALLAAFPLWWRSRAAWFSLAFCATSWLLMAMTRDAGGAGHHLVLLWPFPILFAASALRRLPLFLLLPAGLAMAGSNLLVVNQYYSQLVQHGAYDTFTDALFPLSESLTGATETIYIADWGMFDSLNLLHRGRLKLRIASGPLQTDTPSPAELEDLDRMLRDPGGLWIGHVPEREAFHGVGDRLQQRAAQLGLRRQTVRVIPDSHGRPIFEVWRILPAA